MQFRLNFLVFHFLGRLSNNGARIEDVDLVLQMLLLMMFCTILDPWQLQEQTAHLDSFFLFSSLTISLIAQHWSMWISNHNTYTHLSTETQASSFINDKCSLQSWVLSICSMTRMRKTLGGKKLQALGFKSV